VMGFQRADLYLCEHVLDPRPQTYSSCRVVGKDGADDPETRARYGIYRAIFIDGHEVSWGYEAPKEGLRAAIREALNRS